MVEVKQQGVAERKARDQGQWEANPCGLLPDSQKLERTHQSLILLAVKQG